MFPELFRIPFLNYPVHSYGLMLVVGLLCAIELAKFLCRRSDLDPKVFADAAILALITGLIGARIAYVIQFHQEFTGGTSLENAWNAINLTSGGLVYYGGFLLAFPAVSYFVVRRGFPLLRSMDITAPALMIGLAFGRVGCFLNGCCWGQHCTLPAPLAVSFPYHSPAYEDDLQNGLVTPPDSLYTRDPVRRVDRLLTPDEVKARATLMSAAAGQQSVPVINTQLISTVTALLIAGVTTAFYTLGGTPGRGMALMLLLEGPTRFLIEGMRVEPTELGRLTLSQLIGLGVFLAGAGLWVLAGFLARPRSDASDPSPSPAAASA